MNRAACAARFRGKITKKLRMRIDGQEKGGADAAFLPAAAVAPHRRRSCPGLRRSGYTSQQTQSIIFLLYVCEYNDYAQMRHLRLPSGGNDAQKRPDAPQVGQDFILAFQGRA